jgi:hypothetical protein
MGRARRHQHENERAVKPLEHIGGKYLDRPRFDRYRELTELVDSHWIVKNLG